MNKKEPSLKSSIARDGYDFVFTQSACDKCEGICCRGESGHIWVKKNDIKRISDYLDIDSQKLMDDYLIKVGRRFSIRETKFEDEFPCIFFDMELKKCLIYPVRPNQCMTFPFWEEFKDIKDCSRPDFCPGLSKKSD